MEVSCPKAPALPGYQIARISDAKGYGVVAARQLRPGSVLFRESPIACVQTPGTEGTHPVCAQCLRPLGTLRTQLLALLGGDDACGLPDELPAVSAEDATLSQAVAAACACGVDSDGAFSEADVIGVGSPC